jgi:hypothetical protein
MFQEEDPPPTGKVTLSIEAFDAGDEMARECTAH